MFKRRVRMVTIKDSSLSTGHLFQKPYGEYGGLPMYYESPTKTLAEKYF